MGEGKKVALLRVLQILEKYSDVEHPLTHEDIASYLYKDYDIEVDRKFVAKQITLLHEVYDVLSSPIVIISDKRKGTYIEQRTFEDSELRLLIDGVLSSRYITAKHSKDLIEKLCGQANQYFRPRVKNIYSVNDWNKTENVSVFLNIELIGIVPDDENVIVSTNKGEPAVVNMKSLAGQGYRNITKRLSGENVPLMELDGGGFFARLFGKFRRK